MDKLIGTVLDGRYTICDVIGTGGMSIVYRAEDSLEHREVAVKILKDEYVRDPKFRRRFLNESRAIAVLSHENIVDVLDVNFDGDLQYIVMEYIRGITLKEYMASKGALPADEALAICSQLLSALGHAHERGVIHRDIKPHNIMLLKNGKIKVMDFGIAHIASIETVTLSDMAIGSVHYISPEQAKGLPTDAKSDLYSVGVLLYEMITGKLPFESDTAVSVALMQVQQKAKKPSELVEGLPRGLEQIIIKAMQKDVSMRYQTAAEMLADIDRYNEDHSVVFDYPDDFVADDATIDISRLGGDTSVRRKKRMSKVKKRLLTNKWLACGIGVVAAAVMICVGALTMNTMMNEWSKTYTEVPNFEGKLYADISAEYSANPAFNITATMQKSNTVEAGYVISQTPEAGRRFQSGSQIDVTLTVSSGSDKTAVPDIVGLSLSVARIQLTQSGLSYKIVSYREDLTVNDGTVLEVKPDEGTMVDLNTVVELVVSTRSLDDSVIVPNLVGKTNAAAIQELTARKLTYTINESYSSKYPAGQVISQSPSHGEKVEPNSNVMLIVSKGPIPTDPDIPETSVPETSEPDTSQPQTSLPVDEPQTPVPETSVPQTSEPGPIEPPQTAEPQPGTDVPDEPPVQTAEPDAQSDTPQTALPESDGG